MGVLKAGAITFNPPLPPSKTQAIQRMGMGLLNKIVLVFDRVFWPKNVHWFEYLSDTPGSAVPYFQVSALLQAAIGLC